MKTIKVKGTTGHSSILIGERIENLGQYLPGSKVIVITDTAVQKYYHHHLKGFKTITIDIGEKIKTFHTITKLYQSFLDLKADRSFFIVGVGGGIVCDITGFAASTYMRGLRFGFVSTTLLSQADASTGGKNGVNLDGYKNIIGVFKQPEFVICDVHMLKTLPQNELLYGLAEIVHYAAIGNSDMFRLLEQRYKEVLAKDMDLFETLIYDSIIVKSEIVNKDEKEKEERMKLNFGHTFGHAIEKAFHLPHGEAISIGMVAAAKLSEKKTNFPVASRKRIETLLKNLGLPSTLNDRLGCVTTADLHTMMDALKKDKKRQGDQIHFILLSCIGNAIIQKISINELQTMDFF